jgi:integrase
MPRLTAKFIETEVQCPEVGQLIIRDDELKGFGLRVTKGSMSFIAECRVDGQVRRVTLGKYGPMMPEQARREALYFLSGEIAQSPQPQPPKSPIVTLDEVLIKFLSIRKLRPNTIRNYTAIVKRCLGDWLSQPVTEITRDMVQTRHRELTKVTKFGTPGEVQANMAMRILRSLLNFAASNYETPDGQPIISINPVSRLSQNRSWHAESRRRVVIADSQQGAWYRAVLSLRQKTVRDYFLLLSLTGLRRNEAATLRWTDVDLESKTITIRAELAKNKKEHVLPLTDFLVMLLTQRMRWRRESEYAFPSRIKRDSPIVDHDYAVALVAAKSGCSFRLHDLRRGFISQAARLAVPHHVIKKLVNHVASRDVTDGYVIIQPEHLREPMELINNRMLTLFGCSIKDWKRDEPVAC